MMIVAFTIPFGQRTRKVPSAYAYTSFVSDLVLAKLKAVSKHLGKLTVHSIAGFCLIFAIPKHKALMLPAVFG